MPDYVAGDLRIEPDSNSYYVTSRKMFNCYGGILPEDRIAAYNYAYGMTFGGEGEHREHRTGEDENEENERHLGMIFANAFQGKMAEFALYRYLQDKNIVAEEPDVETYERGRWDSYDLECQNKHISVKSTKKKGQLLLLETGDWNDNGEYIPNIGRGTSTYEYTVLVRLDPSPEDIMRRNHMLDLDELNRENEQLLIETMRNGEWQYDFPGFIYYSELVRMIRDRKILPQHARLNGITDMHAQNYYFQAGNMHSMFELYTNEVDGEDEREGMRLERTCPECGNRLILRSGINGWFWGCSGFRQNGCRFTDSMERVR